HPTLWGLAVVILRFIPFVGVPLAAIVPVLLALSVDPGWSMAIATVLLFTVFEIIFGQAIEPWLFGRRMGLSPLAIVVAATFWTWLWGPVGLVLSTPITLCLVVLGRHVERLKFLDVMFGDQPALTPVELSYQRLLAHDPVEATEQARIFLREKPLIDYYQEIFIPTLKLAQKDQEDGRLDEPQLERIRDAAAEVIDDLIDHQDVAEGPEDDDESGDEDKPLARLSRVETSRELVARNLPDEWRTGTPVLCIPGLGELDEALALVVAQLVERHSIGAKAEDADALTMSRIFSLDTGGARLICLCYVENVTGAQLRYAVRRLRRKAPDARILIVLMGDTAAEIEDELSDASYVRDSLQETVEAVIAAAGTAGPDAGEGEAARSAANAEMAETADSR
ncbi:MAG TPA: AI-2E family transporter, partial [Hyphomicrobiales bacterium]